MNDKINFTEDFYNNKVLKDAKQGGFLGYLYYKLKRFEKHRYDETVDLIDKKTYTSLIDIGCHEGDLLKRIMAKITPKKISGIDISDRAIDKCKQKFAESSHNFSTQNVDAGTIFENETFDLVTMVAVLEHVFDPVFVTKEVSRITKRGGIFIVEVPNIAFLKYRLDLLIGKRPRTSWDYGWDGGHLQYFTISELKKLLRKSGFRVVKTSGSGIFYSLRTWWPDLLFSNIIIKARKL